MVHFGLPINWNWLHWINSQCYNCKLQYKTSRL